MSATTGKYKFNRTGNNDPFDMLAPVRPYIQNLAPGQYNMNELMGGTSVKEQLQPAVPQMTQGQAQQNLLQQFTGLQNKPAGLQPTQMQQETKQVNNGKSPKETQPNYNINVKV